MKVKCIKDYKGIYGAITKGKTYDVIVVTAFSYGVKDDLCDKYGGGCLFDKEFFEEEN